MSTTAFAGQKKELGHLLIQQGLLTASQLSTSLRQQRESGKALGQVLVDLGFVTEEDVTRARAQQVDLPYARVEDLNVDRSALAYVEPVVARKYGILPVGKSAEGVLQVAVASWNAHIMDIVGKIAGRHRIQISPLLASEASLRAAIDQYYAAAAAAAATEDSAGRNGRKDASAARQTPDANYMRHTLPVPIVETPALTPMNPVPDRRASEVFLDKAPIFSSKLDDFKRRDEIDGSTPDQPVVIQFVNKILSDAIACGASDIHLDPRRDTLEIRYRIDGTLHSIDVVPRTYQAACSSRIKIMAEMNIAERRVPLDGRITVTTDGREIDMRVSTMPTQFGEAVVLRILDKGGIQLDLSQLGLSDRNLDLINGLIRKPHGIFLATGPTGSGKTTTLYSAIQAIHSPDVNIITVEDPIEYELEGIRQSNVNEKAGLTFARQLRAILRQDPDIIYVGEIRDAETAEIAFRAALTGHLVFSTLHCNDAAGSVTRLLNMGVDPFLIASSITGVLAQRLVRRICLHCAQPVKPNVAELGAFGIKPDSPQCADARFRVGVGCTYCGGTGYRGRYSVQELMIMDDSIRNLTLERAPSTKIRQQAIAKGMVSMRQDAANKIMQGLTTFEEAQKRVYIDDEAA